jgi:mono/diheme cytochrome c family protein
MVRKNPSLLGLLAGLALLSVPSSPGWAQANPAAAPADPFRVAVTKRAYDVPKIAAAEEAVPDDLRRGRALWLQRCAYCHDGVGQPSYRTMGPWIDSSMMRKMGDARFRAVVATGSARMPGFRYALQPQQVNDLVAFLQTVSPDQKPTAQQLAGRSAGPEGGGD